MERASTLLLLTSLLVWPTLLHAQMNGFYQIRQDGLGDFTTITAAVNALDNNGVFGIVFFDVFPGIYNEQVTIPAISGASVTSPVFFHGFSNDSTDVVITWPSIASPTDNFTLRFDNSNWVSFSDVTITRSGTGTYGRAIEAINGARNWEFNNCQFIPSDNTTPGSENEAAYIDHNGPLEMMEISDCYVPQGKGVTVKNVGVGAITFVDNVFTGVQDALKLELVGCNLTCERNVFSNAGIVPISISTDLNNAMELSVRANLLEGPFINGIVLSDIYGTPSMPLEVINNAIIGEVNGTVGIRLRDSIANLDVLHNSISMPTTLTTWAVVCNNSHSGVNTRFVNNIMRSGTIGLRVYDPTTVSECDYNIYNAPGGFEVEWFNTVYNDMALLYAVSGTNQNSIIGDPQFADPLLDLQLQQTSPCINAGDGSIGVNDDIEGNSRPSPSGSNPDLGAYERSIPIQPIINIYLEGAYTSGNGQMNDDLRIQGLLPLIEPYTALGYNWVSGGGETMDPSAFNVVGNLAVVDWIIVQLRDANDPTIVVEDCAATLRRNGQVRDENNLLVVFESPSEDQYHLAILHRNHLGIMSAQPHFLANPAYLNFTAGITATWGTDATKIIDGANFMWAGDVNFDGSVQYTGNSNDRDPILVEIGGSVPTNTATGYLTEDVNMNGEVKYTGPENDRDPILVNIGGSIPTNIRQEQLP